LSFRGVLAYLAHEGECFAFARSFHFCSSNAAHAKLPNPADNPKHFGIIHNSPVEPISSSV